MIDVAEVKGGIVLGQGVEQGVEPQVAYRANLPRMWPAEQHFRHGVKDVLSGLANRIREIKATEPVRRIKVHQRPQRGFD